MEITLEITFDFAVKRRVYNGIYQAYNCSTGTLSEQTIMVGAISKEMRNDT